MKYFIQLVAKSTSNYSIPTVSGRSEHNNLFTTAVEQAGRFEMAQVGQEREAREWPALTSHYYLRNTPATTEP